MRDKVVGSLIFLLFCFSFQEWANPDVSTKEGRVIAYVRWFRDSGPSVETSSWADGLAETIDCSLTDGNGRRYTFCILLNNGETMFVHSNKEFRVHESVLVCEKRGGISRRMFSQTLNPIAKLRITPSPIR